ncbi:FtsX-like permease family protein [Clostridium sp. ATCC 25772]|uniref:ABC transporter permease n=1 Tax=Clostridium sp. ATCC 25772 TaxID=1676991 RepID=UPI00078194F2|nr:FtsX-like permease family protein [Clostridium sp. ATCC 25772]
MKSFWGLIPRNILKYKKRTVLMGVSIVLAIALITSLSLVSDGMIKNNFKNAIKDGGGNYDIRLYSNDYSNIKQTRTDELFNKVTIVSDVGMYNIPNSKYKIDIKAYDDNSKDILNFNLIKGEYPKNENEVALEDWILEKLPKKYNIGDKIKFEYEVNYLNGRTLKSEKIEKEFILSGIFSFDILGKDTSKIGKAYVNEEYFLKNLKRYNLQKVSYVSLKDKYTIDDALIILGLTTSYKDIMYEPNYSKVDMIKTISLLNKIFNILFIFIAIVAGIVIYNIFNIMVTERTKEFGIFRALGSSPQQIKSLVVLESIFIGIIFIPIGMIIGSTFSKIFINEIYSIKNILYIPLKGIKVDLIIGFLTIILGAYFPARKAAKISPMEAISSNNNLSLKGHKLKASLQSEKDKSIRKNFSFEMNMAYLNIIRNKKRFITTVISLNIIIIMLFSANFLIDTMNPITLFKRNFKYDFVLSSFEIEKPTNGIDDNIINSLSEIEGIKEINKSKDISSHLKVSKDAVTTKGFKYLKSQCNNNELELKKLEEGNYSFPTYPISYDDKELENLTSIIESKKIDIKDMKENPSIVIAQNVNGNKYTIIEEGDLVDLNIAKYNNNGELIGEDSKTFEVAATVKGKFLSNKEGNKDIVPIMSNKCFEKFLNIPNYSKVCIKIDNKADYEKIKNDIKLVIKDYKDIVLKDYKSELELNKKMSKNLIITLYGFIGIISLVSIINLINVMNMSILLRKKDISMLRAIGFSNKQVRNMILSEGFFYGIFSGGLGCALGTIISFFIYLLTKSNIGYQIYWKFPLINILVVLVSTIIICITASLIPARNLFKESIVDSIKSIE